MEMKNKYVTINDYINGAPMESNFSICEETISLSSGEDNINVMVVKNLYISVDPYQLNRMKTHSCSQLLLPESAAILPGQAADDLGSENPGHGGMGQKLLGRRRPGNWGGVIDGSGVGRVVESAHPDFKRGDLVTGRLHWGEYTVIKGVDTISMKKLDPLGFPLSYYAGSILGSSGLAAYGGFFKVCQPKKGDKLFVSAASGSVGILVGQYAKLFGCFVVGCAGTKQKVDLLKHKLGFDDAFNYKEETDLNSTLQRYFPNGIDIYFDNVGGEMLEAAVENMNIFGRVAVCGVISEYTDKTKGAKPDMIAVIYKRIRIEGFLTVDFKDIYEEFISTTVQHLQTGKMQAIEDFSYGVESIPTALVDLFRGNNVGKKVVRIAED
ncbi:hypothetical protein RD792_014691 [Penstemon davidsonii]|uniref:Enoyl reductase (ER) domain-containing protein n=1 Tax=Penstemon davidsonii TaxID=160366 RepID=A0ABR0CQM5_9LAMI|nr:hypothetical protein RD792_014691 [Penstemon davidsonii]